jgi:hypothetical protein
MPDQPSNVHRSTIRFLSTAMIVVGIVLVVRAIAEGGGPLSIGVIAGVLFVAAGAGRWYLTLRQP